MKIARANEFATLGDMINGHLKNPEPSVRDNAMLMALRVKELAFLQEGIEFLRRAASVINSTGC